MAGGTAIAGCVFLAEAISDGKFGGGLVILGVCTVLALSAARYATGCARAGLLIGDDQIVVRNPTRTRTFSISDVLRFNTGTQPGQVGNPTPGVRLELRGSRAYPVWTLASEGFVWTSSRNAGRWGPLVESLNALLSPVQ